MNNHVFDFQFFFSYRKANAFAEFGVNKVKFLTLDELWFVFNKLHKLLEHPADYLCPGLKRKMRDLA